MSCAEGDTGFVYEGLLEIKVEETDLGAMPDIDVGIMMNVGTPDQAFAFSMLPNEGVGLARLEFIINRQIGIHPKALLDHAAGPSLVTTLAWRARSTRPSPHTPGRGSSSCSASPRASAPSRPRSTPSR